MKRGRTLSELFSFSGFRAQQRLRGLFGDPQARFVDLARRKNTTVCSGCGRRQRGYYDRKVRVVRDQDALGWRIHVRFEQRRVDCAICGGVRVERLDWLADNPRYTCRLARQVGLLCRDMTNKACAQLLQLHEATVKELDKRYMQEWLARTPPPAPRALGIDELSIRKGLTYRVVISDLERSRVLWIGGAGRKEVDVAPFFCGTWAPQGRQDRTVGDGYVASVSQCRDGGGPQARIVYDKFHILRHLSTATTR